MEFLAPESGDDVLEIVKAALANETPLAVNGNRTLDGLGRPVTASKGLSTRALSGVHFYEPSELVVSLGPGTTLRELTDLLDQNGQELAFEPIDYGALFGREPLSGTVGGMVEINSQPYKVVFISVNTFSLTDLDGNAIDTTGFTAYTSGGFVSNSNLIPRAVAFYESRLWYGGTGP